jgi:hypothetical protein
LTATRKEEREVRHEERNKIEHETYQQKIKKKEENKKQRELNLQKHLMDLEAQKESEIIYQRNLELRTKEDHRKQLRKNLRKNLRKKYMIYEDIIDPEIYGGFSDILLSNSSFLKRIIY